MSEETKYNDDMRFVLYPDKDRTNEKAPAMTGVGKIAGVELRFALWLKQVSKNGVEFWSGRVDYKQGATRFLVPISPSAVEVKSATAVADDVSSGDNTLPF